VAIGGRVVRWRVSAAALMCVTALCAACAPVPAAITGRRFPPATLAEDQAKRGNCAELSDYGGNCGHGFSGRQSEASSVSSMASPPRLDMLPACKKLPGTELSTDRTTEACLRDENVARDSLASSWPKYKTAHKAECTEMVKRGGSPSYVELISCLEVMDGAEAPEKAYGRDGTTCDLRDPACRERSNSTGSIR
jgi:hypothetical protein